MVRPYRAWQGFTPAYPPLAQTPYVVFARRGHLDRVRSGRDRRGNLCALRRLNRIRRVAKSMSTEPRCICPICGNEFDGAMEFCPVCMLRQALAEGIESGEPSASADTVEQTPE